MNNLWTHSSVSEVLSDLCSVFWLNCFINIDVLIVNLMQYIVLFTAYSWLIDCASSTMLTFCVCWAKFVHCALDWTSFICENNRMVTWNYTIAQDSRCQVTISLWTWGIILPSPKFPKSWRNFFHYSLFLHIWSSSVSHCGMIPFKQIMKTCEINYRPWRIMWTFNSSLAGGGSCSNLIAMVWLLIKNTTFVYQLKANMNLQQSPHYSVDTLNL